jgi:hypothetical protein
MRYPMPHHPREFEIPDDWLAEAGMRGLPGTPPSPLTWAKFVDYDFSRLCLGKGAA